MTRRRYTAELTKMTAAIQEAREVLKLRNPGMDRSELAHKAIEQGALGRSSTTRVNDIVKRTFAHRFLTPDEGPARRSKAALEGGVSATQFRDIVFLYTMRAYALIYDFLVEQYWPLVYANHTAIEGRDIVAFLNDKSGTERIPDGWSENVTARVARNLGKTLTDFGFFEDRRTTVRRFRFWRASDFLLSYFVVDSHENGTGDTAIIELPEWEAFGMDRRNRIDRLQRLAGIGGPFLFQFSGELVQFTWNYETIEELVHATARSMV